MKTTVEFDPSYAMLTVDLEPGEAVKAEPGAMVLQHGVEMKTGMGGGGLLGGFKRMLGGESFFVNTFTAERNGGRVSLAPSSPGDIGSFNLQAGMNLFVQSGSFLACTENIQTDAQFQGLKGFFSGESLFFIRVYSTEGVGTVFYNSYGAIKKVEVEPGMELRRGHGTLGRVRRRRRVLHRQGWWNPLPHRWRRGPRDEVQGHRRSVDPDPEPRFPGGQDHPLPAQDEQQLASPHRANALRPKGRAAVAGHPPMRGLPKQAWWKRAMIPAIDPDCDYKAVVRRGYDTCAAQVEAELERHVLPAWEDIPVDAISQRDVLALLAPLFQRAPRTAARLRQRIRSVFRWAMSWEWIAANPAGEGIDGALPTARKATPRHYAALHYTDIEGAIAKVWQGPSRIDTKRAIVFTILTASRSGEVRFMTWRELSPDGRTWEIPGPPHEDRRTPPRAVEPTGPAGSCCGLSGAAEATMGERDAVARDVPPPPSALVFPGHYVNPRPLSPRTMQAALETAGVLGTTPHGFRSSFRDWAAEQSRASHSAIELSLAHKVGSTVEQAYFRSDLLEQRRELMQAWADYCAPSDDDAPASWERFSDVPIARNMPFFSPWSEQTLVPTSPPNLTKTRNFSLRFTLAL